jgi:MFS family permease
MGVLALILGVLTIAGVIQLWHVYLLAFLSGSAAALDAPVRQTFVAEMVGDADLTNAVALNSTSFNAAQMIGPAVAGLLIASVGIGWAFLLNGLSFAAVPISMSFFRLSELHASARAHRTAPGFLEGLRYVWRRPDLRAILTMLFLIGTFGLNFPIFISGAVGRTKQKAALAMRMAFWKTRDAWGGSEKAPVVDSTFPQGSAAADSTFALLHLRLG